MIRRIDSIPEIFKESVFTSRINALLNTYRKTVGVDLFSQTVDGSVTAVFGGMDGSFTLISNENADYEELSSYFSFCGAVVFCEGTVGEKFNTKDLKKADLYEYQGGMPTGFTYNNGHDSIEKVYHALEKGADGDIKLPPFEFWYTDFCSRFNHNSAEYFLEQNVTAVAGFVDRSYALVTGVAVDKACRGKGLGKTALLGLIHNILIKFPQCQIIASTVNAGGFYENLNFKHCGTVAVLKF